MSERQDRLKVPTATLSGPPTRRVPKGFPSGIEQRGRGYYAVRDIPRPLHETIGKRRFVKSLKTRDLHVAKARNKLVQADFQREIDAAESAASAPMEVEVGLAWKETYKAVERGDAAVIKRWGGSGKLFETTAGVEELSPEETARMNLDEMFDLELEGVGRARGGDAVMLARGLAHGTMTPLLFYVDAWLAEGGTKGQGTPRTQRQYRSDLDALAAWLKGIGVVTLQGVTKRVVGRYVTEALLGTGMNRVTANRKISAPSSYWRWLIKRTDIEISPWVGASLSKGGDRGNTAPEKRPFTDPEVVLLFSGERLKADPELADTMRVGALSGLRLEEIYRLTVADCAGGWFGVRVDSDEAAPSFREDRAPSFRDDVAPSVAGPYWH